MKGKNLSCDKVCINCKATSSFFYCFCNYTSKNSKNYWSVVIIVKLFLQQAYVVLEHIFNLRKLYLSNFINYPRAIVFPPNTEKYLHFIAFAGEHWSVIHTCSGIHLHNSPFLNDWFYLAWWQFLLVLLLHCNVLYLLCSIWHDGRGTHSQPPSCWYRF